jgi:hypothetical protein
MGFLNARIIVDGFDQTADLLPVLIRDSHLTSYPRAAWSFFMIFFLLHGFASLFSSLPSVFLWHKKRFVDICAFRDR